MKFTVLLSLYFKEKPEYFEACLESINNQTLRATEVVIVIDGHIDNELNDIIGKWNGTLPIKVLRLAENVGLGNALNKGLEICSNDIVIRMDTDDICCLNRFELQLAELYNDDSLVLLGGHIEEYSEKFDTYLGKRIVPIGDELIKRKAVIKNPFNHMTVAFRKSAVQAVGGYKHHSMMEDYNLWLRIIAANYKVGNLDAVLVKARTGNAMLLRRRGVDYIASEYALFKLKKELKLQSLPLNLIILLARSLPRLMSTSLLRFFYKTQRQ